MYVLARGGCDYHETHLHTDQRVPMERFTTHRLNRYIETMTRNALLALSSHLVQMHGILKPLLTVRLDVQRSCICDHALLKSGL
jgi:hypothetical protein